MSRDMSPEDGPLPVLPARSQPHRARQSDVERAALRRGVWTRSPLRGVAAQRGTRWLIVGASASEVADTTLAASLAASDGYPPAADAAAA